jgi:hypothetical protein
LWLTMSSPRHQSLRLMQASNYEGRSTSLTKRSVHRQTIRQTSVCGLAKLAKHMNACDNTSYITDKLCQEGKFSACLYPPPSNVQVVFSDSGHHEMAYATSTPLREVEGIRIAQSVIYVAVTPSAVPQPPVQDTPFLFSLPSTPTARIAALYQPISTHFLQDPEDLSTSSIYRQIYHSQNDSGLLLSPLPPG